MTDTEKLKHDIQNLQQLITAKEYTDNTYAISGRMAKDQQRLALLCHKLKVLRDDAVAS